MVPSQHSALRGAFEWVAVIAIALVATFLIRTFWIGLLYGVVSAILSLAVVGILLAIGTAVWIVVRCIIGLQKATAGEPIAKPETWWV